MKILCFIFFVSLFACNEDRTINTVNQYQNIAAIQLREVLGNFNCQSTLLKKDSIILGKADHHTSTQYSFHKIDKDSIIFSYKAILRPITLRSTQIDTGMVKLKCVNFQSPEIKEIRELVDSMLFENVNLAVWRNSETIEALPAFTNDGRSFGKYTIQNLLKDKLSVQEINDIKYNGMYYSSPQLNDLDLSFFKGKNVIWLNEQEARDTGFYLKIYTPLFNTDKTLCFLRYDLVCNRIDECGSGIYLVLKKEKGQWNRIHTGEWES
jgi:hypothetical protein